MKTKLILTFITGLLVLGCLTGCGGTKIEDDLVEKYSDYWDYALGEYTCDSEWDSDNGGGSGGFTWTEFKVFEFHYTDDYGNAKSFRLSNDDEESNMAYACSDMLEEELLSEIENRHFEDLAINAHISRNCIDMPRIFVEKINPDISFFDTSKGVKIKSLCLDNLSENNLSAVIEFYIYLTEPAEDYPDLKNDLLDMTSFIFDSYDYEAITVKFFIQDENTNPNYCLTYDGNQYSWSEE